MHKCIFCYEGFEQWRIGARAGANNFQCFIECKTDYFQKKGLSLIFDQRKDRNLLEVENIYIKDMMGMDFSLEFKLNQNKIILKRLFFQTHATGYSYQFEHLLLKGGKGGFFNFFIAAKQSNFK